MQFHEEKIDLFDFTSFLPGLPLIFWPAVNGFARFGMNIIIPNLEFLVDIIFFLLKMYTYNISFSFFCRMIPSTSDGLTVKKIQVKNPPICLNYLPSHEQAHKVFIYTNLITNSIRLLQMPCNGWYNQTGKIHAFKR